MRKLHVVHLVVVLHALELEGLLLRLALGHDEEERDVGQDCQERDHTRANKHLLPAHVADGVVHGCEDERGSCNHHVVQELVAAIPVALKRDGCEVLYEEVARKRGAHADHLAAYPDGKVNARILDFEHQRELSAERE